MPIIVTYTAAVSPYTDWLQDVIPDAPGLDTPYAVHVIRNTAIDFCTRTWVYQYDATGTMTATDPSYDLTLPANTEVTGSIFVKAQKELTADEQEMDYANRRALAMLPAEDGPPRYYSKHRVDEITFHPTPDAAYTFTNRLALRPTFDSTTIDSDVFARYRQGIAHGVLYRLMSQARKPWSDPAGALMHGAEYVRAIREAKIELMNDYTDENMMVDLSMGVFA